MNEFAQFWMQRSLNQIATKKAEETIDRLGKCLPCTVVECVGQIVTVSFDPLNTAPGLIPNLTVPVDSSAYDYVPYQPGDKGVVRPTNLYIGNLSELGPKQATNTPASNLGALVFTPVGKKSFSPAASNARIIQAPGGWINQTTTGTACSVVGNTDGITLTFGSNTITINSSGITLTGGGKTVTLSGSGLDIDGIVFETHLHGGVTTGSGDTTAPLAG